MMNCKSTNHDELTSQLSKAAVHLDASADRLREMKTDILHAAEQSDATQKQQDRLLVPVLEQWEQLAALCEDVCCLLDSA